VAFSSFASRQCWWVIGAAASPRLIGSGVSDNPELSPADSNKARSGAEAFPELAARRRGRPETDAPKVAVKIRIARDVLAAYQAGGPGWQTRMHDALRKGAPNPFRSPDKTPRLAASSRRSSKTPQASSAPKLSSKGKTRD
jgi:uncharacterized protein (DUF4415 family)